MDPAPFERNFLITPELPEHPCNSSHAQITHFKTLQTKFLAF